MSFSRRPRGRFHGLENIGGVERSEAKGMLGRKMLTGGRKEGNILRGEGFETGVLGGVPLRKMEIGRARGGRGSG